MALNKCLKMAHAIKDPTEDSKIKKSILYITEKNGYKTQKSSHFILD